MKIKEAIKKSIKQETRLPQIFPPSPDSQIGKVQNVSDNQRLWWAYWISKILRQSTPLVFIISSIIISIHLILKRCYVHPGQIYLKINMLFYFFV